MISLLLVLHDSVKSHNGILEIPDVLVLLFGNPNRYQNRLSHLRGSHSSRPFTTLNLPACFINSMSFFICSFSLGNSPCSLR